MLGSVAREPPSRTARPSDLAALSPDTPRFRASFPEPINNAKQTFNNAQGIAMTNFRERQCFCVIT